MKHTYTAIPPQKKNEILESFKWRSLKDNFELTLLTVPALILFLVFSYFPMYGTIIAFKAYNYADGILGSKWVGLDNFKFFFTSMDAWRITRNTLGYSAVFLAISTVAAVTVALFIYEVSSHKFLTGLYQTTMTLPRFMSWVIVGYIVYVLLDPVKGLLNAGLEAVGAGQVDWYMEPKYWPFILVIVNSWKNVGVLSLIYYAALSGLDVELFEAAEIDGANRRQQIWHISIPGILPVISINIILAVGDIFRGDFGLFYNIPMNIGALYSATDIIDTYVYRGLKGGDMAGTAAVGLFQSVVGLVTVLVTNFAVKKISPENSLF